VALRRAVRVMLCGLPILGFVLGISPQPAVAVGVTNLFISSSLSAPDSLQIGQPYFFDVTIANLAPAVALTGGATLTSTLSPLLPRTAAVSVFLNPSGASVDCSATVGQNLSCLVNNLGIDKSLTIRVVGFVAASADPSQTISIGWKLVAQQEPGTAKQSIVDYPIDPPPTDLQVVVGSANVAVGSSGSLLVSVNNLSNLATFGSVTTRVTLPALPAGIAVTPPAGCTGAVPTFDCATSASIGALGQASFNFGISASASAAARSVAVGGAIQSSVYLNDLELSNNAANGSINIGPLANADSFSSAFGAAATGALGSNDIANAGATFALATNPMHGNVTVTGTGTFDYRPAAGFTGVDTFTYTVTSPSGMSSTATVTIHVGPKAVDDTIATAAGASVSGSLATNDVGAAGASWSGPTAGPSHGNVTITAAGTFTYTPTAGYSGPDSFTYTVTNPDGTTATASMTIAVGPIAINDTVNVAFDQPFSGSVATNDSYVAGATFARGSGAAHGTVDVRPDGTFIYKPTAGYSGPDQFSYTVTNPNGTSATATVAVNVGARAADDQYETTAGRNISNDLSINDRVAVGAIYSKVTDPAHGSVTVNPNGTFTYVPNPGFSGTDSFVYVITNVDGTTAKATATIRVTPKTLDDTVLATGSVSGTANRGGTADPNAVCAVTTQPAHGTVVMKSDCTYVYTPDANFSGQDSFVYTVTNPDGSFSSSTVTLNVRTTAVLPQTGSETSMVMLFGLVFLALGIALVRAGRARG
jgi:LPXTG-motif cell wall-anchored protein